MAREPRSKTVTSTLFGMMVAALGLTMGALQADASVLISVDKSTQQMSVSVDGVQRYQFPVSTARTGYSTPNGTYHPQRLEKSWFSREYYNSPMPHSIFFHGGYAIHGSYEINALGGPASHGCVRLHPANAATLFALVKSEGMGATTIVVSGSNPGRRAPVARDNDVSPRYEQPQRGYWQQQEPGYYQQQPGYYRPYEERGYTPYNNSY